MRKISEELKNEIADDNFYKKCCIQDENCLGRIEWHHNLIFKGQQVNEKFCILPVCKWHHDREKEQKYKEKLNWIMWNRATPEQITFYSKAIDYKFQLNRLNKIYGFNYK